MKKTILVVLVLILGMIIEVANADLIFGTPTPFDEPVNSTGIEYFGCISFDGLEVYIDKPVSGGITSTNWDIYVSTRETINDPWSVLVSVGPTVHKGYVGGYESLSSDGLELWFSSTRPGGNGLQDIWVTTRDSKVGDWGAPVNLGPPINTSSNDLTPWITPDGLELYFSSDRPGGYGVVDIWVASRTTTNDEWGEPVNLGPVVNSTAGDYYPCLSPDGLVLFFSDYDNPSSRFRPGGHGYSDMWMTRRKSTADPWEEPVNLGPDMNTSSFDSQPRISPDGSVLYFTSSRPDLSVLYQNTDIWQAPIFPGSKAHYPNPADGAFHEDTWASLSWSPGHTAASHNLYFGDNFDEVNNGTGDTSRGNQTSIDFVVGFPGFPYPDGFVPGKTYYWRIDAVEAEGTVHEGDVWSFTVPPKTAYLPDPADGAESIDPDGKLSWTPGFGAKVHTVYFGDSFDDVSNAAGGLLQADATYSPGTLELAKTYYWRVDEFEIVETHKGDVWSFTTEGAVGSPIPAKGAVDITQTPVLTWTPGFGASHEVYFGTDASSLELKGSGNLGSESYDPGQLEWDTTYYWRVDEANNTNTESPWIGPLWSFTTANFLIIDDFEGYNNLDPADSASNRIFNAWLDGLDNPTVNGSVVGYENPPFAEQTIVHSGNQSMPMAYENAVGKSETTLMLTSNRDWTVNGVNTLTIWFRGSAGNAAETLYVALNDSAVVNNDNPDAATRTSWTEWNIDLQAFAGQGVNLTNVTSITLGLGDRANPTAGGSGMMYFDDIQLHPLAQ